MVRTAFLITIDTEGDDLWSRPTNISTDNARFLSRFQSLCERYAFRPTYLANYEMVMDATFAEFGRDVLRRAAGEIGMHLHAWNTPPDFPLTSNDHYWQPYLTEYPLATMKEKIARMTGVIGEQFGIQPKSHRAGRWALNSVYARCLADANYLVDCSVTPGVSWRRHLGDPQGGGGADYRHYPTSIYALDLSDPARPGDSQLLEIPMTIIPARRAVNRLFQSAITENPIGRRFYEHLNPVRWLRPRPGNGSQLIDVCTTKLAEGAPYVEFMLHSSELMQGGSPTFRTARDIELLYDDMERLLAWAADEFVAATLLEFASSISSDSN
jgi:hypothetical protein